ncbi:MAG: hypothetical protein M3R59_07785 [Verrucomicrobiota bacterium]|nr:hypothetical protein [Verrucomicrobiota bacterium]
MEKNLRARFNASFTTKKYAQLLHCVNETERFPATFRVGEAPVFLTSEMCDTLVEAAHEIVAQTRTPEFRQHAAKAIPRGLEVPKETAHPNFIQVDFGLCDDGAGGVAPRLIELQGFPSLYGFQLLLYRCLRDVYKAIPHDWVPFFSGINEFGYIDCLREVIVGNADPQNVVLLEIEPEKQDTRVDFACMESMLGIRSVCVTEVRKVGRELFYQCDGRTVRIERIYNRVIFDELIRRPDLQLGFSFRDDLDVHWAGHPNWYFRISKHALPFLQTDATTPAYFADQFPARESLGNYVLKPLYSFSGLGVDLEPTRETLRALDKPHDWILQQKVHYVDLIPTPDGPLSKVEIRMMFVWPDGGEPMLVNNLVRMSQGAMMGVKFNKDKTWVGSSVALHRPEPEN